MVINLSQMKKLLLFFSLLTFAGASEVFAQEPVVIKEEGAVEESDVETDVRDPVSYTHLTLPTNREV